MTKFPNDLNFLNSETTNERIIVLDAICATFSLTNLERNSLLG